MSLMMLPLRNKEHCRSYYLQEEQAALIPLPATPYQYMDRSIAKVSSDFHVRFDNAYYSVDKAYLHKKVVIRATVTEVKIFSLEGELIAKWPRASKKGEWQTNPEHLPQKYKDFSEWNSTYFIRRAATVGINTTELIKQVLKAVNLKYRHTGFVLASLALQKNTAVALWKSVANVPCKPEGRHTPT